MVMGNVSQCAWEIFPSREGKLYAVGLGNIGLPVGISVVNIK